MSCLAGVSLSGMRAERFDLYRDILALPFFLIFPYAEGQHGNGHSDLGGIAACGDRCAGGDTFVHSWEAV